MKFIDMHCDSVMYAYFNNNEDCYKTTGMCDVRRLKEGDALTQFPYRECRQYRCFRLGRT